MCCARLRPVPVALRRAATFFSSTPLTNFQPRPAPVRLRAGCAAAAQPALRLPVAHDTTTGRSLPLHPLCFATGPRAGCSLRSFHSMRARWGNVSHTARGGVVTAGDRTTSARRARSVGGNVSHSARGGVDNHHDDPADRAQAHDRRRPRHPPVLRNGGWRGLRLTIRNSTSTPLARPSNTPLTIRTSAAQPARQAPLNPGLSRWLLPLVPHRTPHRFATTNASRETNARRTTNAPGAASFGRVYDAVVAPASP